MARLPIRRLYAALAAPLLALSLVLVPALASPVAAATTKVVIIVGPVGDSTTATYINDANAYAAVARQYTSNVTTIYSPHATWAAVKSAIQGANIVVYLGHGNGFPSPYSTTLNPYGMDGFGLNATDNAGNSNWQYYGEYYIANEVRLASNAVVIFSRLCYASGNSEWGAGTPTLTVAEQRVQNYAAGFISAGAKAVIADGLGDAGWYISGLFTRHTTIDSLWRAAPDATSNNLTWGSDRSAGFTVILNPHTYSYVPDGDPYYRSMVSIPSTSTDSIVGAGSGGGVSGATYYDWVNLRSGPSTGAGVVKSLPNGTGFSVTGAIVADGTGRTWAPVRTTSGYSGYIATAYARFSGTPATTAPLNVRSGPSTGASVITVLPQGARFTITNTYADSLARTWFALQTSGGATGWVASWYTQP